MAFAAADWAVAGAGAKNKTPTTAAIINNKPQTRIAIFIISFHKR